MNTVLVVVPDEAIRTRRIAGMRDHSVFVAQNDADALKTLRLIDIDFIVRGGPGLLQGLEMFIARVKEVSPSALTVVVGAPGDDTAAADFVLLPTFGQRELEGALRHVTDKLRLTREVAALRSDLTPRAVGAPTGPDQPWEGAAFARVLKEFTRAFAAGFDLPRALEMFLDATGELVRPTRMALLLPGADAQEYRVATHRGLAPQIVGSVRLSASHGLVRWLAAQGRPARLVDLTDPDVVRELKLLQSVLAVPLLTPGHLVGVLTVGHPVVGSTYEIGRASCRETV